MRVLITTAILLVVSTAAPAAAADWALNVNGISRHQGECEPRCNENNTGLGAQYSWRETTHRTAFYTGGTLINSVDDRSWYVGGGWQWGGLFRAGVFVGAISYPTASINPVPAVLPMFSLETHYGGLNVLYIPAVTDEVVAAWLLQGKINFR